MTRSTKLILEELRRKYQDHDTSNFNIFDFLAAFGSPVDALMYLRLFSPEFVELEGMVFRQETLEDEEDRERVIAAYRHFQNNPTKTEQSFNMIEIPSGLFSRNAGDTSDEADELLAKKLVALWSQCLAAAYPSRIFIVEMVSPQETGGEVGIVFYEQRSATALAD